MALVYVQTVALCGLEGAFGVERKDDVTRIEHAIFSQESSISVASESVKSRASLREALWLISAAVGVRVVSYQSLPDLHRPRVCAR